MRFKSSHICILHNTIACSMLIWSYINSLPAGELRLKEKDLGVLTDILKGAVTKWKVIGLALGFLDAELTEIEHKPLLIPEGDTGYFREMLSRWLKWAPSNHRWPTLEALALTLNKAGEESLAYNLKEQYLSQNGECCVHVFKCVSSESSHTYRISLFNTVKHLYFGMQPSSAWRPVWCFLHQLWDAFHTLSIYR